MNKEDYIQLNIFELTKSTVQLQYYDLDNFKDKTIETCFNDLFIICNALDDYANLLEQVIDVWELRGRQKAAYEYHTARCRKISSKLSEQIGYDKEKVKAYCAKKAKKRTKDDVGEESLILALKS